MATATPDRCPSCNAERPANAPAGLCPRCLLRAGLDSDALSLSRGGDLGATIDLARPPSVLETLAAIVGPVPRVLLRDTDPATEPPLTRPGSPEMPGAGDSTARLKILGEIARGGMGAVLRGRDEDLGRDLAVKVLLEQHRDNPDLMRRFIEEAQIGGQLQHPGIVPIYELGAFADRRPYFAMKLVKGQTLAEILAARKDPSESLPRLLGVFEHVCQTVAYAHARGVIHRDLKPSNIMVGGFGEVQVMDWGLAKVLSRGGVIDDERAGKVPDQETLIATARSGGDPDAELSRAGSVMGTPSYMAPEQARGEVGSLDERADVFALGSILCEILTGQPAFVGRTSAEILRRAARGDTAEALVRLEACGAEAELVGLARACLAAEPMDRPRDARAVSARMTAHLAGVQERLRAAEIERARAEARAAEERKRRRVQVGLAASLLALSVVGGLSFTYVLQQRQAQSARVDRLLAEATLLRDQARVQPDDVARWERAGEALARLADDFGPSAPVALVTLRQQVESGLEAAEADRTLLEQLVDIRSAQADDPDGSATDASYAAAFAAAGLAPDALEPAEAGGRIARRPEAVAGALRASLDHWAGVRRTRDPKGQGWRRLLAVARAAEPDPDRSAVIEALLIDDPKGRLERLRLSAERTEAGSWAPASLVLLGGALAGAGDVDAGVAVLRKATGAYPGDAPAHFVLGQLLGRVDPPQPDEAIRSLSVSRALHPELAGHDLAHALERRGRGEEAEGVWRDLVRRRPGNGRHLACYGNHLVDRGREVEARPVLDRAIAACREAIRMKPDFADAHVSLGLALKAQGKLDEAIAAYREAIRLGPDFAEAHCNLGNALQDQGKLDEAIAAFREAIRLKPDLVEAHYNLGNALQAQRKLDEAIAAFREAIRLKPDDAGAHYNLGNALREQGNLDEAIAAYREAIRLKPDFAGAHYNLGNALREQGKLDEAIAAYREAIRLKPDDAGAHDNLGIALSGVGKPNEAIAAFREAIHLKPDLADAHYNLGIALSEQGKLDEAIAAYREAIRLQPDHAETHCNLGLVLRAAGDHAGSLDALRRGHELGSRRAGWPYPSADWVAEAERMVALAGRLPAVLSGEVEPADNDERLAIAQLCYDAGRYAAAARLWEQAIEADPALAEDLQAGHRYNAACAAALAGGGRGKDDPPPDEAGQAALRAKVLGWLRADLESLADRFATDPAEAHRTLTHWKADPDLAAVRDPAALASLPESERADWQALWAEVDRLLGEVGQSP